jgi:hypothetical protein
MEDGNGKNRSILNSHGSEIRGVAKLETMVTYGHTFGGSHHFTIKKGINQFLNQATFGLD